MRLPSRLAVLWAVSEAPTPNPWRGGSDKRPLVSAQVRTAAEGRRRQGWCHHVTKASAPPPPPLHPRQSLLPPLLPWVPQPPLLSLVCLHPTVVPVGALSLHHLRVDQAAAR